VDEEEAGAEEAVVVVEEEEKACFGGLASRSRTRVTRIVSRAKS
jgi:hypothetical protein